MPILSRAAAGAVAGSGGVLAVLALTAGEVPGPLLQRLGGPNLSSVVVLAVLVVAGSWVLRRASGSAWRWATGVAVVAPTAQLGGLFLRVGGHVLADPSTAAWSVVHWLGTAWLLALGVAALVDVLDRWGSRHPGAAAGSRGLPVVAALRSGAGPRRRRAVLLVAGLLVLGRLPYLVLEWPGVVFFDTFRSLAYSRGTSPWEAYEPVGNSLLVTLTDRVAALLDLGDTGLVALATGTQVLATSAAFAFLLARMATWRVPDGCGWRAWPGSRCTRSSRSSP